MDAGRAGERLAVEVVLASRLRRTLGAVGMGLLGSAGEGGGPWAGQVVKVVDRVTGQCVLDSKGGGDPQVFAARVEAELDELSLEKFCAAWGVDLPPA